MSQVLYRKYRSQDFSQIFGQESVKKVLVEAIRQQKTAHAYLFTGPRGTGKTSMARILAKSLNCTDRKDANPCNACSNCLAINESRFMDLIEIDAASNRGIDEIRDLKEKVGFLPVEGTSKVYIIDEVHMLTSEAFNALLKTLEEPPQNVVFILATTEAHKLPLTIISRTQRFDFKPATDDQLKEKLKYILDNEKIDFEEEALDVIVDAAGGSFRDSESVLEKVVSSQGYKKDKTINVEDVTTVLGLAGHTLVDDLVDSIYRKEVERSFELVQRAQKEGVDFFQYTKQLLFKARGELTKSVAGEDTQYPRKFLFDFVKEFLIVSEKIKTTVINTLPLELAILNIIGISSEEGVVIAPPPSSPKKSRTEKTVKTVTRVSAITKTVEREVASQKGVVGMKKEVIAELVGEVDAGVELSFEAISLSWGKLLKDAKKANPHLAAILVKIVLKSYEEGRLFIEVPFKFHQKQLEGARVNSAFQELAKKVYGCPIALDVSVNGMLVEKVPKEESDSNISVIEEVFADLV